MGKYLRLSFEEREEFSRLLALGLSFRAIGRACGRNSSTISREVGRFRYGRRRYRALISQTQAQLLARRRKAGRHKLAQNVALRTVVFEKLRLFWSPEQVAEYLKATYDDPTMRISKESIYTYIYVLPRGKLKEELVKSLRRSHKRRRKDGRGQLGHPMEMEDMISIEERPKEVADRSVPGHWEGDVIVGGRSQSFLGTLVERRTRAVVLVPLKGKSAEEVCRAFTKEVKKLPEHLRLSMTYDQGREMAQHKLFTKNTKMKVYFAHPKSPWERGTSENTNGLLRQYFPKGLNLNLLTRKQIKAAQDSLNTRPRKTLGWKTPLEAMQDLMR